MRSFQNCILINFLLILWRARLGKAGDDESSDQNTIIGLGDHTDVQATKFINHMYSTLK
jgi:hypothetical protein